MRVMKFGGSSLATPRRLNTVCGLVREAAVAEPVVVVTSAPAGVTNLLQALTEESPSRGAIPRRADPLSAVETLLAALLDGVRGGASALESTTLDRTLTGLDYILSEVEGIVARCARRGSWDPASKDRILGAGERLSAHLLSALLETRGTPSRPLDAGELILTNSEFGKAVIDEKGSARRIRQRLGQVAAGMVPVIPGFTGGDEFGRATTLGRGTSDLTASLVGAAISARVVELWTDVDGIHAEDPARFPGSPVLPHLEYEEAREMALNGAEVIHPRTLDPIQELAIPLRVRNTLRPEAPGTWVGSTPASDVEEESRKDAVTPSNPPPRIAVRVGESTPIHLVLAGATGQVAGALLEQLQTLGKKISEQTGFDLRIGGAFTSRTQTWSAGGFLPNEVSEALGESDDPDGAGVMEAMTSGRITRPIFVDVTASSRVAARYREILDASIPLVTANKLALSGRLSTYRSLQATATRGSVPFRYETTVGAALPVLHAARDRRRIRDRLFRLEATLSGTLAFVFARLAEGSPFSLAVKEARALGFTEPDPREDLAGADVERKILILLRESGYALEPEDIPVESLVPPELASLTEPGVFLDALPEFDGHWNQRAEEAARQGRRLVYGAYFTDGQATVGVRSLPGQHPMARLAPGENLVLFTTDRYRETPLSISGPGAGPAVTASGVLCDILSAADQRYGDGRGGREGGLVVPEPHPPRGRRVA